MEPNAPWWVQAILTLLRLVRGELRDLRARLGQLEDVVDEHANRLEDTKTRNIEADLLKAMRKPWGDALRTAFFAVLTGIAMLVAGVAIGRCYPTVDTKGHVTP